MECTYRIYARVMVATVLSLFVFMFVVVLFPRAQPEYVGCQVGEPNMEVRDLSAPDSSEAGEGQEAPDYGLGIPGLGGCAIYFDTPRPGAFD